MVDPTQPLPSQSVSLTADRLLHVDARTEGLVLTITGANGTELMSLTLPMDLANFAALSMPGLDLNLYRSSIDSRVVLDVLTDLDGIIAHRDDEQPLIRVNVNDATVHDPV